MTLIQKPNPGDLCRVCKQGHLQARTRSHNRTNRDVIGGPVYPTVFFLHELVCGVCGCKFEPQGSGQNIDHYLEDKLLSFTKPQTKPEECPQCHLKDLVESRVKTSLDTFPISHFADRNRREEQDFHGHFLYCKHCLIIVWHEPPKPDRRSVDDHIADLMNVTGSHPKSRGSATPIPKGKVVRRRKADKL